MEVRRFEPFDFLQIRLQPMQANLDHGGQTLENGCYLATSEEAYTATHNGEVVACIGLVQFWPGRRLVWAYLSADAGRCLIRLTWQIRRWLRYHGQGRIECAIDPEFPQSIAWAERLGFVRETPEPMREWIPGKGFYLYARVA